jgi:hypothetical protein
MKLYIFRGTKNIFKPKFYKCQTQESTQTYLLEYFTSMCVIVDPSKSWWSLISSESRFSLNIISCLANLQIQSSDDSWFFLNVLFKVLALLTLLRNSKFYIFRGIKNIFKPKFYKCQTQESAQTYLLEYFTSMCVIVPSKSWWSLIFFWVSLHLKHHLLLS